MASLQRSSPSSIGCSSPRRSATTARTGSRSRAGRGRARRDGRLGEPRALRAAIASGAQLIVTHHGLFWDGDDPRVVGARRERLAALLRADVSLAAYHLPLDAHPVLGNNALLASGLGLVDPGRSRFTMGVRSACTRASRATASHRQLVARVATLTGREPLGFLGGPPRSGPSGSSRAAEHGASTRRSRPGSMRS